MASVGLYNLVAPDERAFDVRFDRLLVHPDFNDLNNDLALLRTSKPVALGEFVQPVCLVNATRSVLAFARRRKCYSLGYGLTSDLDEAVRLQKLEISVRAPSECNSDQLNGVQLRPGTVCVGPARRHAGASCRVSVWPRWPVPLSRRGPQLTRPISPCAQGDSGGPNHCYDPASDRWYLFGTVSYGPSECERAEGDRWLTVSVDLSIYRSWILATVLANE